MADKRRTRSQTPGTPPPDEPELDDKPTDDCDEHAEWAAEAWSEIDVDVERIVSRIELAERHLERAAVESRDAVGLAHGELKVLFRLTRGPRGQGDIAKKLLVSTGTMTNQLDKLEASGLVVRHPDPNDRRGKLVEMTQKGRQILDAYVNRQAKRERDLLSRLGPAERLALNDLLRKLVASITAEQPK